MSATVARHGYGPYTNGCRCGICRAAKREYSRQQRAGHATTRRLAQDAGEQYVAAGITHGISGYQNYSCRCYVCCRASADAAHRQRVARLTAGGGS